MSEIRKIGIKNPAAVIRDISENLETLRSLTVVGIHEDDSVSVWKSETPDEIERASVVLLRFAMEAQGESK